MSTDLKYPRTPHLPDSPGKSEDDITGQDPEILFSGKEVVVTEKMDGENSTLTKDSYYARSLNTKNHPSRTWIKQLWSEIRHDIPANFRICGENLYAQHSIHYSFLDSYFLVFSIWDNKTCLSWDETLEYVALLGLVTVPVLYRGIWDYGRVSLCYNPMQDKDTREGYVVRVTSRFNYDQFSNNVCKFVRKLHVQTEDHWMYQKVIPNGLQKDFWRGKV